ncbi:MAG: SOS response-associated peptidase [Pseudomonadota bacterium]
MCGRFSATADVDVLRDLFAFEDRPNWAARWNVAPTQDVPAALREDGRPRARSMRWGLIPGWATDPFGPTGVAKRNLINARIETASEKPAFRDAWAGRRAIVFADAFYEWRAADPSRTPQRIALGDGRPFAFAALSALWRGPDGALESCCLLTRAAPPRLAAIHHRAPVALDGPDAVAAWLDAGVAPDAADALDWAASLVSRRLNAASAEGADLMAPDPPPPPAPQGELF